MISIICSSQEPKERFKQHVLSTSGVKDAEFIFFENKGELSLTEVYNRGLHQAKYDIIVFLHHDIELYQGWGNKLLKHYKRNPEYGILGCAGTKNFSFEQSVWWADRKSMYGAVYHTFEGKTWLTRYSEDQANNITEVCVLDGVFFSCDRTKIKVNFDESVKGFHFYDISWCVENFLAGVNLGVFFDIKINHYSPGITNEQWESNRVAFCEKYQGHDPLKIKRSFNKQEKMNVLISCLNFREYTGSELYFSDLAKQLSLLNCNISICSNITDSKLINQFKELNVKFYSLNEPPCYKMGGEWKYKTPDGKEEESKPGILYNMEMPKFDLIIASHIPVVQRVIQLYPQIPVIQICHSEIIELENGFKHDNVKYYIAIRPEIKDCLIKEFDIPEDKIDIIYNPIDNNKFKPLNATKKRDKKRILFVGTLDYLRENVIKDLIETTKNEDKELWLVGINRGLHIDDILKENPHVKYFQPTNKVEDYIRECDETAGILLGRTTIESWLMNKPSWIYNVDNYGTILSKEFHEVPNKEYLEQFYANNVAKKIYDKCVEIINL